LVRTLLKRGKKGEGKRTMEAKLSYKVRHNPFLGEPIRKPFGIKKTNHPKNG